MEGGGEWLVPSHLTQMRPWEKERLFPPPPPSSYASASSHPKDSPFEKLVYPAFWLFLKLANLDPTFPGGRQGRREARRRRRRNYFSSSDARSLAPSPRLLFVRLRIDK